jgi:putative phosphoesterase
VKIGVVSDTHGFFDARLDELLAGVELILHAGDVGKQDVLDDLAKIAPVRAVRGNVDSLQLGLPTSLSLKVGGMRSGGVSRTGPTQTPMFESGLQSSVAVQVEILHQLPATQAELEKWASQERQQGLAPQGLDAFLGGFQQSTRVVIFGHSHVPCVVPLAGKLFFNSGSAGKQRFSLPRCCGLLAVSATRVEATILSLQQYNGKLPKKAWVAVGG